MVNIPDNFNEADIHNFNFGANTAIFILVSIALEGYIYIWNWKDKLTSSVRVFIKIRCNILDTDSVIPGGGGVAGEEADQHGEWGGGGGQDCDG